MSSPVDLLIFPFHHFSEYFTIHFSVLRLQCMQKAPKLVLLKGESFDRYMITSSQGEWIRNVFMPYTVRFFTNLFEKSLQMGVTGLLKAESALWVWNLHTIYEYNLIITEIPPWFVQVLKILGSVTSLHCYLHTDLIYRSCSAMWKQWYQLSHSMHFVGFQFPAFIILFSDIKWQPWLLWDWCI